MGITIKALAEELNLSTATVSRVLSGRGRDLISPATQERVIGAARRHRFRPNAVARALATGRTHAVGLLTFALYPAHYTQILCHMQDIIHQSGYNVLIRESMNLRPQPEDTAQIASWAVDGILAFDSPATVAALRQAGLDAPLVCFGTAVPKTGDFDCVWVDAYAAAYEALNELVKPGMRRVAMLGLPDDDDNRYVGDSRAEAYLRVLAERGLQPEFINVPYLVPDQTLDRGATQSTKSESLRSRKFLARRTVAEYVAARGAPEAIFCHTDDLAIGTLKGLLDAGLRVPDDVLLLGFDGVAEATFQYVDLSTVVLPERPLCEEAWRLLRRRIEQPDAPFERVTLLAEAAARASTRRAEPAGPGCRPGAGPSRG